LPTNAKGEWRPWEPGDPVIVLPYGHFRTGKTFGAATFPRPCFLDFDRGLATIHNPEFLKQYGFIKFQSRSFWERDYDKAIVRTHNAYDDACRFFDEMMGPSKRDSFDTWVVDSCTMLGEYSQHKGAILLGSKPYGERSKSHELALKYQLMVPVIQDYGAERSLVEQFVDMVLSSSKHAVFICHEKEIRDKQGNLIAIAPMLTGQSAESVPLRIDEVYNIQATKGETHYNKDTHIVTQDWMRVCQVTPDGLRRVGSRNGVSDGIPWNYASVLAALTQNYQERLKLLAAQTMADKAAIPPAAQSPTSLEAAKGK
jgi:AAA domain-containing protein